MRPTCARSWRPTGSPPGVSTELAERHGETLLADAMAEVLDYAERRTRAAIATIPDGTYRAADVLEDDGRRTSPETYPCAAR